MKDSSPAKKHLHHICIQTNDYKASLEFYVKVLEFELVKETPDFHGRKFNTWLSLGAFFIEMQTPKEEGIFSEFNKESQAVAHICFYVQDILEEYQKIKNTGFSRFASKNGEDIYLVNGGRLFKLIAPEGTIIEFRDSEVI